MGNVNKIRLIIFSSKSGGPYKQHHFLYKKLLSEGYNVVHWFGFSKWVLLHFLYGKNIRILTNVPFLFRLKNSGYYLNIHGNYNIEKNITNPLGYFYNINLNWANKIIVPNIFLKNKLKINKALVISNLTEEITPTKILKKEKIIKLVTITNFSFRKKAFGVVDIIKALSFSKIKEKIVFDIYGSGKYLNTIKLNYKKIKLPANIEVNFCGYSKFAVDQLSVSDIFVYWSKLDVAPVCLIDAMACGLPIVINNFPAFVDFIDKNNLICKNRKEFSLAIDNLILNKDNRKKIGLKNKLFHKRLILKNIQILNDWKKVLYAKKI